jgi:hypothetical protein
MSDHDPSDFGLPKKNSEVEARSRRLRTAVDAAGRNFIVATRAGMPAATLGNYLGGRDMKAQAMIDLAAACGVRLEWLACGHGPMRAGDALNLPADLPFLDLQVLAAGLEIAEQVQPEADPEVRISMALKVAEQICRSAGKPSPVAVDLAKLGAAFRFAETLITRQKSAHQRLQLAAEAYHLTREDRGDEDLPRAPGGRRPGTL